MSDKYLDHKVNIIIEEFSKIKTEIHQFEASYSQIIVFVIASFTIIIPVLSSNLDKFTPALVLVLLFLLTLLYSAMTMQYCYTIYAISVLGKYIQEYLFPQINSLLSNDNSKYKFFYWEEFVRQKRKNIWVLLSGQSLSINGVITVIPSLVCVLIMRYIIKDEFVSAIGTFNEIVFQNKDLLYYIALTIFTISIISLIASFILTLKTSFNHSPKKG